MGKPGSDSAIQFTATWRDYAPIALTNLALTIVTLGIYRFWATARTRQFLWSHTRFIGDPLEWTGTGKELFIGFLMAMLILLPVGLAWQLLMPWLTTHDHGAIAGVMGLIAYGVFLAFIGLARFRALRYRLSRTLWRGIRGGSDDTGFNFAGSYVAKTVLGALPIGLAIPWSMTQLWNERWNRMSFGSAAIAADSHHGPIFPRFLLFYLLPFLAIIGAGLLAAFWGVLFGWISGNDGIGGGFAAIGLVVGIYAVIGIVTLGYYSAFFRNAVNHLHWADLNFGFTASTMDWMKYFLGNVALVVGTLGIGAAFLPYRSWRFMTDHLEAFGEIDMAALGQSTTHVPGTSEGLLEALDIGAF